VHIKSLHIITTNIIILIIIIIIIITTIIIYLKLLEYIVTVRQHAGTIPCPKNETTN